MPTYDYWYEPCECRKIYRTMHGMSEKPEIRCPECDHVLTKMISAPNLNLGGWSSPTEAKYSKMTESEEMAREKEMQKTYETIWLPPPVKHNPWDEDH